MRTKYTLTNTACNKEEDYKKVALAELRLMRMLGLSYSELQNIPLKTLKVWQDEELEKIKRRRFEMMVERNKQNLVKR